LALTSNDLRQSEAVLQELRKLPESEQASLLPDLCSALTHADSLVRCRAIRVFASLHPEPVSCVPLVLDRLHDPSWPVREAAALALGQSGLTWPGLVEALVGTVLHDPQKLVRDAAARTLAKRQEESQTAALQFHRALDHPHVTVRARALLALGRLPAHAGESVPLIRKELHASHWRVRLSAAEALGELGQAAVPAAADLVRRAFDGHRRVSRAARAALDRIRLALPESLCRWLETIISTDRPMDETLRLALERPELPESVRRELEETMRRRQLWQQQRGGTIDLAARTQEQIWLTAHLFELLCRHASGAASHEE